MGNIKHRRRIKTDEKAKVVAAAWVAELIKFLAALSVLHQDDLKNRMNCTRTIYTANCVLDVRRPTAKKFKEKDEYIPFLHIILVRNS